MSHDLLHHQHVLAYIEERNQARAQRSHRPRPAHSRARPGRLRRATAMMLVRVAERLARQQVTTVPRRT